MTLEVNAVGVTCNLACSYCYEHNIRDAGNFTKSYDLNAIKEVLSTKHEHFTLFGGEALLMPIEDLEDIWKFGFERNGSNGIQTNGSLITPEHVAIFKKYNVHVGISMDGPDELNDIRWAGSLEKTREMTARSMKGIEMCREAGVGVSLIVTLHNRNASKEKLPKLKEWFKWLASIGIQHSRLHLLEIDHDDVKRELKLSTEDTIFALMDLAEFEKDVGIRFDLFKEVIELLTAEDRSVSCVWKACDPFTTPAVQGVGHDGSMYNCSRAYKDGVDWVKAPVAGKERQLALYNIPQEYNGCKGCRFFVACKGQCPGTGEEYDWRNRTDQCEVWFKIFEHFESKLIDAGKLPISISPRLPKVEELMIEGFNNGHDFTIWECIQSIKSGKKLNYENNLSHGDHSDGHGDIPHGDKTVFTPHGDSPVGHMDVPYGDHTNVTPHGDHIDGHKDVAHGDSDGYKELLGVAHVIN